MSKRKRPKRTWRPEFRTTGKGVPAWRKIRAEWGASNMGLDGSGHPTLYRRMHEHKELIADNPSGMALLPSPHNFSSNPGFIDNAADATSSAYDSAKKAVLGAAKTVSDKVSYAKDAYKSTMQE